MKENEIKLPEQIVLLPIQEIGETPNNSRTHSEEQLNQIADSIKEFGFTNPVLIDENKVLIAGNGRLYAARKLKMELVPTITLSGLSESQKRAYVIADNKIALNAGWDIQKLNLEMSWLKDKAKFDITKLGFSRTETDMLLNNVNEVIKNYDQNKDRSEIASSNDLPPPPPAESTKEEPEKYTRKIESPVYEPKLSVQPLLTELYDPQKADTLTKEIEKADIAEDVKHFLRQAAKRHTVFNYENIAEYYCHASPEIQELMEKSGLVVIDFNKAIEFGFVKLTKDLAANYELGDKDESEE